MDNEQIKALSDMIDFKLEGYNAGLKANISHETAPETRQMLKEKLDKKVFWTILTLIVGAIGSLYGFIWGIRGSQTDMQLQLSERLTKIETIVQRIDSYFERE